MLDAYKQYLIGIGRSQGTIKQRMHQLYRLAHTVDSFPNCTEADLDHFMATTLKTASPETRKSMRGAIRGFYAWATKRGYLDHDPAYQMESVRIPRALPRPVPDRLLKEAYELATEEEKAMMLLGAMGGLRLSEITHLHMDDREENVLRVRGKGGRMRQVPLNSTLRQALDRMEQTRPYGHYFPNPKTGRPWSISYVGKHLRANLPEKYAAHSLRHRAASVAYSATKDIRSVQELLGHSSVATTQIYTAITSDDLRAVANATDWKDAA